MHSLYLFALISGYSVFGCLMMDMKGKKLRRAKEQEEMSEVQLWQDCFCFSQVSLKYLSAAILVYL